MARLKKLYFDKIQDKLQKDLQLKNKMMVPRLEKIVVNSVTRDAVVNGKVADSILNDLSLITGQRAVKSKAKKSVASFKLREGQALGAMVTLRGERMYEFLDKLVNFTLPRVRDFRGVSPKAFDGRGNFNLGVKEQIIFPEINYDKIDKIRGLNITIVTSATDNKGGRALLTEIGMPFKK